MNAIDYISFFHFIEEKLWGDKVNANKYFATLSILFAAMIGACHTEAAYSLPLLRWNIDFPTQLLLILAVYLWMVNTAESVFACKEIETACLRSLLILLALGLAYGAGIFLGTVALVIVITILFLFAFYAIVNLLSNLFSTPSGGL